MVYDGINNVAEYTEDGVEHYESLIFYEVDDFSLETYEKLDTPIREDWKRLLTRDNLPCRTSHRSVRQGRSMALGQLSRCF